MKMHRRELQLYSYWVFEAKGKLATCSNQEKEQLVLLQQTNWKTNKLTIKKIDKAKHS